MKAVLLDALGTLVDLDPPWPALVRELASRGVAVSEEEARRAVLAEMRHYRARCHMASDRESLARLRAECAEVLRAGLPDGPARGLAPDQLEAALLASLRFRPFPEVPEVLRELRLAGLRTVVVSNWDVSLHDVLESLGLDMLLDSVVTSAEAGAVKPQPEIFVIGLRHAGVAASQALHVGDDMAADVEGARRAGIAPVLVARRGEQPPAGVPAIGTLAALPGLVTALRRAPD